MGDQALTETLNQAVQHGPSRLLAVVAATWLLAVPVLLLVALAGVAVRRREPHTLALTVLGLGGALVALGLRQLVDHLYFRPRPYWALGAVRAIGDRRGDSAFFSRHAAIAAALTLAILLINQRWGLLATATTLLLGLGRVAAGAEYPSDVLVGLAVGAAGTGALLPTRPAIQRTIGRWLHTENAAPARPHRRELRLGLVALLLLAVLGGWLVARVQDHGLRVALNRRTGASAATCPPTRGCTGPPASKPSPMVTGGRPAPAPPARSPTSTANQTATSTSSSKPRTAASSSWRSSPSSPSRRPTTTTASPPGASSATTASTTGGNSTR